MLLTQILHPDGLRVPLLNRQKHAVIEELVDLLHARGLYSDRQAVLDAVLAREALSSTGIGSSLAIPHGKTHAVSELAMAVGVAPDPIDFESIDRKPVSIVILLVSPPDQTALHIQALAKISRLMLDSEFKTALQSASSPEQAYELITDAERREKT